MVLEILDQRLMSPTGDRNELLGLRRVLIGYCCVLPPAFRSPSGILQLLEFCSLVGHSMYC